ncbi:MAG: ABC-F family ATP-binding cassette domain-containing protein [Clostridiales bacterium]|nr:ABC-F family ATP-binding cassette domain-containing protein [Clostridiales bacterium]
MLDVKNLTIELKDGGFLINDLSFSVKGGDKLAIIGEEGTGKSTLLKAIINPKLISDYAIVTGGISNSKVKIGYCEQNLNEGWNNYSVMYFFLKENLESEEDWEVYNQIGEICKLFDLLHLKKELLDNEQFISTLSGGEKVKLQLCKILLSKSDILLLDEPTNDLDIQTLDWLESFIVSLNIPVIYVSHDVKLLEKTANRILLIEYSKNRKKVKQVIKNQTYTEFITERENLMQKQEQIATMQQREYSERKKTLSHIKSSVRSNQIKIKDSAVRRTLNKKMANILAQEEQLKKFKENMQEMPNYDEFMVLSFMQDINVPKGKTILDFKIPELSIKNTVLAKNISLTIKGGSKIAIIGENGCGKSTLLKHIYKHYNSGNRNVKIAYIPQNYNEYFDMNMSATEFLNMKLEKVIAETGINISTYLACLKFSRNDMLKPISQLSYGQKVKIILLDLTLNDYEVLILDELTRNLSPLSITVINNLFKSYTGNIISVTHDRKFIEDVIDEVYVFTKNGLIKK